MLTSYFYYSHAHLLLLLLFPRSPPTSTTSTIPMLTSYFYYCSYNSHAIAHLLPLGGQVEVLDPLVTSQTQLLAPLLALH